MVLGDFAGFLLSLIYPVCFLLIGILLIREEDKFAKISGVIILLLTLAEIIFNKILPFIRAASVHMV